MSDRNWDAEMAKIDRQLASLSDDQLVANRPVVGGKAGAVPVGSAAPASSSRTSWGVAFRVGLVVALAVGLPFWPYASRCGVGLAGYLAATAALVTAGVWSAISTWRARAPRAHALTLIVVLWGLALATREVLPRVGYAKAASEWVCK